jgi:aminoglycoside 2''-phosphotransferase
MGSTGLPDAPLPFPVESVEFEGEGDFCRAYTVNGDWIFRFAYNEEGSRALQREIDLLPRLAPALELPIPKITHHGRQRKNGFLFVGYPKIESVPFTSELLLALQPDEQERCARDLALFLRGLHSFSVEEARALGVPECDYPFCRTEEGNIEGSASEIYRSEGERLANHPSLATHLDGQIVLPLRMYVGTLVKGLLNEPELGELPPALVHGDLSSEHVLFDAVTRKITGVIDFSDAIITTPLLDFAYLRGAYGPDFLALLFKHYEVDAPHLIAYKVRLLRQWHTVLRLLWALDHDYVLGIQRWALDLLFQAD